MAGRLDDRLRGRLQRLGISALEPRAAARLLVRAAGDDQDFAVLPVRWADWFAGHGGEVPAALCSLRASGGPPPAAPAPLALAKLPAAERTRMLAHEARSRLAAVLGFGSAHDLPSDATFRDLGLDSLLALDAKERLEQLVGVPLSATLLFDQPDLPRLLAHLEERLANAVAG